MYSLHGLRDIRLTTIGITGHRFIDESSKLIRSVDKALKIIEDHFDPPYTFISSLAEGADRLVPYRAFARWEDARLIVSLPLEIEDYMQDFSSLSSSASFINLIELAEEILQPAETTVDRDMAYQAAGKRVLELSDVLFAVWDGMEAQGKGGTAEIVACARELEMPILWIHAGNRLPGTEKPVSLGNEQGKITLENFRT